YSNDPYIIHPIRVMGLCKTQNQPVPVLAASLLHDVLEDTDIEKEEMRDFLHNIMEAKEANKTLQLVIDLTDIYTHQEYPNWNRYKRKAKEKERLGKISPQAQTIKYADIIDNGKEILAEDPQFAPRYLRECRDLLEAMQNGNPDLRKQALQVVRTGLQEINRKSVDTAKVR